MLAERRHGGVTKVSRRVSGNSSLDCIELRCRDNYCVQDFIETWFNRSSDTNLVFSCVSFYMSAKNGIFALETIGVLRRTGATGVHS